MAARAVASLALSITARTKGLKKGLARANKLVSSFAKQGAAAAAAVAKLGLGIVKLGAGFAALGATAGLIGLFKTFGAISSVSKVARKLGAGVNTLQTFRDAAKDAGIESNILDMAFQRATRRISEAAKGQGEAVGALKELRLNPQVLMMKTFEERMLAIGTALQRFEPEEQLRIAFKLFDSEGAQLVNMFTLLQETGGKKGVAGGFDEFREALARSGREMDERSSRIEKLIDRFRTFGDVIRGVFVRLALGVGPALDRLLSRVEAFVTRGDVQQALGAGVRQLAKWISQALTVASKFLEQRNTWKKWGTIVDDTRAKFATFVDSVEKIVDVGQTIIDTFQRVWSVVSRIFRDLKELVLSVIRFVMRLAKIAGIVAPAAGEQIKGRFAGVGEAFKERKFSHLPGKVLGGIVGTAMDAMGIAQGKSPVANAAAGAVGAAGRALGAETRVAREDIVDMGVEVGKAIKRGLDLETAAANGIARGLNASPRMVFEVVGN